MIFYRNTEKKKSLALMVIDCHNYYSKIFVLNVFHLKQLYALFLTQENILVSSNQTHATDIVGRAYCSLKDARVFL